MLMNWKKLDYLSHGAPQLWQAGAKKRQADHNKTKMVYTVLNSGSFDFSRPELSW